MVEAGVLGLDLALLFLPVLGPCTEVSLLFLPVLGPCTEVSRVIVAASVMDGYGVDLEL